MALSECSECGGKVSDRASACPHCGAPIVAMHGTDQPGSRSWIDELRGLKDLVAKGTMTEAEYEVEKQEILARRRLATTTDLDTAESVGRLSPSLGASAPEKVRGDEVTQSPRAPSEPRPEDSVEPAESGGIDPLPSPGQNDGADRSTSPTPPPLPGTPSPQEPASDSKNHSWLSSLALLVAFALAIPGWKMLGMPILRGAQPADSDTYELVPSTWAGTVYQLGIIPQAFELVVLTVAEERFTGTIQWAAGLSGGTNTIDGSHDGNHLVFSEVSVERGTASGSLGTRKEVWIEGMHMVGTDDSGWSNLEAHAVSTAAPKPATTIEQPSPEPPKKVEPAPARAPKKIAKRMARKSPRTDESVMTTNDSARSSKDAGYRRSNAWQSSLRRHFVSFEATVVDTVYDTDEPCLNLRERPNHRSRKKACMPDGTQLTVQGTSGRWYMVTVASGRFAGRSGFAHNKWINEN